ncbi:MAG: type II secretion system protein GspD [Lysobacteraceae bacterium]|nr:MAG: type II secretion system protein GspD [Xanthomonadaceae bacterium]
MTRHSTTVRSLAAALLCGLLAACASVGPPTIQRGADPLAGRAPPPATVVAGDAAAAAADEGPVPVVRRGTGRVIDVDAARTPLPSLAGTTGAASFNFEGESLHVVIKSILGDMLGQNYIVAPGVSGTVTISTQKPVSPAEARDMLEMILGWNNARMVYSGGRYNIVPADQPLDGSVAPRTGPAASARGWETRVVPLQFISATEMEKILQPYARPNAIVNVDAGRNVITVAGSRLELENYLRTIDVFDVDWMASMSVGVFPLQSGRASDVVEDLEKVFGEQSKSPVAGMFRFMPLEAANAVMVITPQAAYLDQIGEWLERIDGAGAGLQLFSYELKYVKAKDLADRLAEVFGGSGSRNGRGGGGLMPGLQPTEIRDGGIEGDFTSSAAVGGGTNRSDGDVGGGLGEGTLQLDPYQPGNGAVTLNVDGDQVGVSAVDETNTLLVRSTGQAWRSIRDVIERLDVMPLQVHIEAQVAEVQLTGDLRYGVNWFFEQAVDTPLEEGGAGLPSALGRGIWGDIAGSIRPAGATNPGLAWTFLGRNAAAVISALDEVTDVRLLQSPSVLVRNNVEATLNVGTRIPIQSVSFYPGGDGSTYSQVQYLDTGVILKVRPRVTRDGMVFLDLVQEVSSPGAVPSSCASSAANCNVPINTRRLKTEAAIQSGDTVLLAGLISEGTDKGSSGVPGLSRLPLIGSLFGSQHQGSNRSEVIILLTPQIVRDPAESRDLTDEYGRRFRAMEPLYRQPPRQ